LIIELTAFSQTDSIRGKKFQLTGKIVEEVQLTPHCGGIAWGTVVVFEVIDLVGMNYPNKKLGIIITCPEFYKTSFLRKAKQYQVVFSDLNQASFGWLIPNKDLLKKNALSFEPYAISVKKIP
jgi:hypothetical protein